MSTDRLIYATYGAFGIAISAIGAIRAFNRWATYHSKPTKQRRRIHPHP